MNKLQIITFEKNINLFVYLHSANESIPFTLTVDIDKCLFRCVLHIITNLATLLSQIFILPNKENGEQIFFNNFLHERKKNP